APLGFGVASLADRFGQGRAGELRALRKVLSREATTLERRAAAAQAVSFSGGVAPSGGCTNGPYLPHGKDISRKDYVDLR
ncbi:MAG: hypothetical protein ACXVHX_39520, partial [Solirubrobacteraceae bacterium]